MKDARVPLYYWGPPLDDYAMNPSHPVYQKFMAEVWFGSVALSLCATIRPLYTRFTQIFSASVSETIMRGPEP